MAFFDYMDCDFAEFIVNTIRIARYLCRSWDSSWYHSLHFAVFVCLRLALTHTHTLTPLYTMISPLISRLINDVVRVPTSWTCFRHRFSSPTPIADYPTSQRLFVCLFVCQHDNFRMTKHRMMKLGGRCIVQKSRPSSNFAPGCAPQKCGIGVRRLENQRK